MEPLSSRPVSRDPDDGIRALYECQACLYAGTYVMDPYDEIPQHVTCPQCGWNERRNNMTTEECFEYYQDGTCKHRDTCDCWCHKEEDES